MPIQAALRSLLSTPKLHFGVLLVLALSGCSNAPSTRNGFDINFSVQADVSVEQNIPYGAGPFKTLDIYSPSHPLPGRPVLIFFHGGLFQNGDKKDYTFVGQTMAQRGVLTIVVNYTLYPQGSFPSFVKDGADSVAWIRENIAAYGGNPRSLYLMGRSAGAYIATMLALDPEYLAQVGLTPASISGVIGISGLYDFLPMNGQPYAPAFNNFMPLANTQPIAYASNAAPAMLLISSKQDDVVNPENTTSLANKIKAKGGKATTSFYPQTGDIGLILAFSPLFHGSTTIVDEVTAFVTAPVSPNAKN